jgi:hypothetical protein
VLFYAMADGWFIANNWTVESAEYHDEKNRVHFSSVSLSKKSP